MVGHDQPQNLNDFDIVLFMKSNYNIALSLTKLNSIGWTHTF